MIVKSIKKEEKNQFHYKYTYFFFHFLNNKKVKNTYGHNLYNLKNERQVIFYNNLIHHLFALAII